MASKFAEIYVLLGLKKEGFDKGVKSTKSSMKDMGKSFAVATAAIAATGYAIYATGKKIYEVGKRGAIVTQTADSFEYLSEKIGLAPDILEQLQKESKGTISDFKLMSDTATLLAGTSDELGKALGDATPELMKIAKAANKLNPALGTTNHMYNSIALGIKRASPLILDNLGLTIKIGDANETMAKQLGKSVEALTAEEKQMALLNATLEAGDKLLAQVGGTTDAAADSFEIAEAQVQNLKDGMTELVYEGIQPTVSWFAKGVQAMNDNRDANIELKRAVEAGLITQEESNRLQWQLIDGWINSEEVLRQVAIRQKNYETQLWKTEGALRGHAIATDLMAKAAEDALDPTLDLEDAERQLGKAAAGAKGAIEGLTGVLQNEYKKALEAASNSVYELERMKLVLKLGTEDLSKAEIEHSLNMLDSIDRMETLTQAVEDDIVSQQDLRLALADGLVTLDEYNEMMGIVETKTGDAGEAMRKAEEKAFKLGETLADITSKEWDLYFNIHVKGKIPNIPGKGEGGIPFAKGGSFTVPGGYPNDSFLIPMALTSGEHVEVTPKGKQQKNDGDPVIINIYNPVINSEIDIDDMARQVAEVYVTRMQ